MISFAGHNQRQFLLQRKKILLMVAVLCAIIGCLHINVAIMYRPLYAAIIAIVQCTSDFTNYAFYELRNLRTSTISPFRNPILVIQIKTDFTNFDFYELRNLRTAFMVPLSESHTGRPS